MTFVTRISLRSGDRDALDAVVADIKETCQRKGAVLKGPYSDSPTTHPVSLYRRLDGDPAAEVGAWDYTVYRRRLEIRGHDDLARNVLQRDFPDSVQVEAEVEQTQPVGSSA